MCVKGSEGRFEGQPPRSAHLPETQTGYCNGTSDETRGRWKIAVGGDLEAGDDVRSDDVAEGSAMSRRGGESQGGPSDDRRGIWIMSSERSLHGPLSNPYMRMEEHSGSTGNVWEFHFAFVSAKGGPRADARRLLSWTTRSVGRRPRLLLLG